MDQYRQNAFNIKFASAAVALGVTPEKIVSLKIRDMGGSHNEYRELVLSLEREFGFQCSSVAGELQGRGHLLTKEKSRVIVVERESGLEILYIAGSIASLIGLIPMILQGWNAVRRFGTPKNPFNEIEVRRLDEKGDLQEHVAPLFDRHGVSDASNLALTTASLLEEEFQKMKGQIERLLPRIAALEKRLTEVEGALKVGGAARRSKRRGVRSAAG
ncbi:MAG: hypothetical protein ABSG04_01055 [Verrucomicrobiota bacterium]|jgi:hypothetical protein